MLKLVLRLPVCVSAQFPLLFLLILLSIPASAQKWGYATLIARLNANYVQLVDTNSVVVKQWNNLPGNTGYSAYLTEGGDLWRTAVVPGNSFQTAAAHGRIQKIAWDGTILFDYTYSTANHCLHHDISPMPNGNVLVFAYVRKTAAEVQAAGATINQERWTERILELQPTGLNTANIVWEWNLWDHLVQNLYPNRNNYQPSILANPGRLNINYNNSGNNRDWIHMNSIDYNAELDQIVVSSRYMYEVWVIDHSTTTAEAATSSGGNSGKGGDFIYRWGNPAAYTAPGQAVFNVIHDAHWVPKGSPREGWLGVFNNFGISSNMSSTDLWEAPWDGTQYSYTPGQAYLPSTYGFRQSASGFSGNMSSTQQLPNGNMLVCLAAAGRVQELGPNGNLLWQYNTNFSWIPKAWRYSRCFIENPKIAVANPAPTICSGGTTQLNITPSATNANSFSYEWSPADGLSSATVQNPVVSGISDSTIYTVKITTPNGCSATASIPVNVSPLPDADAGNDVTILSGQSATLTATGGGGYLWNTGQTVAEITVSPLVNTTYTVTVTDANGCSATDEVTVSISVPILLEISTSNEAFCSGNGAQLNVTATGGNGTFTYTWSSDPAGFSSDLSDPVVSPLETTLYTVQVSDGLEQSEESILITVYPLPIADAGSDVGIYIGESVDLTATGGEFFSWSTGESTASITVAPTETSTYTVTVTDANDCTASATLSVQVNTTLPLEGSVSPVDTSICLGGVLQLFASASNGTGDYSFSWSSEPPGFSSTLPDPYINPEESTVYTVEISDGLDTIILSIEVVVFPVAPQPGIMASGNSLISSSPINNQWFFYGSPIDGATDQVFNPTLDGSYQVQVTDDNGCPSPLSEPYEYFVLGGSVSATGTEICLGEVLQLLATATNGSGNYSYSWTSEPPGFVSTLPDPYVNPEENTVYIVEIADGLNTVVLSIEIVVFPVALQPSITVSGDSLISSSPINNQWFFYGSPIAGATGQVHNPAFDGTYQVQVTDDNGCPSPLSEPYDYFATIPLGGSVSASDSEICLGEVLQLLATATNGSGSYSYSWSSEPPGFVSTLPDPYVNPEENTVYTVEISDGLNTLVRSIEIVVFPLAPQPSITVSGDSLISSSPINNQWFFYGSPIAGATEQVHHPAFDGTYQVQVTDENGCPSPLSDPYDYFENPLAGSILATETEICLGDVLQLFAVATNGSGNYNYAWSSEPPGFVSTLPDPYVNPEENTMYTVLISDGANTVTLSIEIVVFPPAPQPGITVSGDSLISSSPINNQWFFYGSPIYGATEQVFSPVFEGTYQVQVTDENGCPSPLSEPYEHIILSTGTVLSEGQWTILPNPATNQISLLGDFDQNDFSVEIRNSTGALVLRERNARTLSVAGLSAGVYWVRLNTSEGSGLRKVVVLR